MAKRIKDGTAMVAGMSPELMPGRFAFVTFAENVPSALGEAAISTFREAEGVSLIVPSELAPDEPAMRLITLNVFSALDGVGLTAAVAGALAGEAIPCNVVAAFHHDHIFVPEDRADRALIVLQGLAAAAG